MPDIRVTAATPPHEAASHGRRLAGWIPSSTGPVKSVEVGLQTLRNRSRDACRNDSLAAAAVRNWVSGLIGSGIVARTRSEDPDMKRRIDELWNAWLPVCISDGSGDFYAAQSVVARGLFESGEVFIRNRPRRLEDRLPAPVQFEIYEADMLPLLDRVLDNGNQIVQGVEFDRIGRRVAYWFHRAHPGDGMGVTGDLTRVPAEFVSHLFAPARPGQVRGVPMLSPVLAKLRSLGNFDDAVLHRQELANLFVGFVEKSPTGADAGIDPLTGAPIQYGGDGSPVAALEPGLMQELLPGESVKFSAPPDAGANYAEFTRQQQLAIAAGIGLPYELLTGDVRDVSDRTLRVVINAWHRAIEAMQWQVLIPKFCQFVREGWADAAVLAGVLSPNEYHIAKSCEWSPPRHKYIHPVQDVTAMQREVEAGFRSRASVIAEMGYDVADVDAERAADAAREMELGIQSEAARLAEAEAAKLEAEAAAAHQQAQAAKAAAAEARAAADKLRADTKTAEAVSGYAVTEAQHKAKVAALEVEAAALGLAELRAP